MSARETPLPGQTRCPTGHLCSSNWEYCPDCGEPLEGANEAVTDGGVATVSEEADLQDSIYYRVEGIGKDDVDDPFLDLANDIFDDLREHHPEALEGVIPVLNEEFDPRLGESAPRCAATGCEQPMDHVVHGVLIDGTEFDVPTCGGHDGEGGDA